MNQLFVSIGSLLVGVIASVLVSRYYFRRSNRKSLTPYLQFMSTPLRGIDPDVRRELKLTFQSHTIDNFLDMQLLIANTGDKAIRDIIKPLTLYLPEETILLDATMLHVSPEGRTVSLKISDDKSRLEFFFPLLNRGDFFIVKLLLDGPAVEKGFTFTITADELPPTLSLVPLPFDAIATTQKREFELSLLTAGLIITLFGIALARVIYDGWAYLPNWSALGALGFFIHLGYRGWALLLSILPAFVLLLVGPMMTATSFTQGSFPPPKRKFIVPDNKQLLRRNRLRASLRMGGGQGRS